MMGAMAPPSEPLPDADDDGYSVPDGTAARPRSVCGECGAMVGNLTLHTGWHAGTDQTDALQGVLDFLDGVDAAVLEAAALGPEYADTSPIEAALDVLKRTAAQA